MLAQPGQRPELVELFSQPVDAALVVIVALGGLIGLLARLGVLVIVAGWVAVDHPLGVVSLYAGLREALAQLAVVVAVWPGFGFWLGAGQVKLELVAGGTLGLMLAVGVLEAGVRLLVCERLVVALGGV